MKNFLTLLVLLCNFSIIIAQPIKIVDQSKSSVHCEGNNVEIWVDADGDSLMYNWYKDGNLIPNETSRFLTIKKLNDLNSGVYFCIVSSKNDSVSVQSKDIAVYMATPTKFIKVPNNESWEAGKNIEFVTQLHTNDINELKNIKIRWYKEIYDKSKLMIIRTMLDDNNRYSGTKTERLSIKDLVYSDIAYYTCVATGLCGSDSIKVSLGDTYYFKIIRETGNFNECEGQDAVFRVRVEQSVPGTLEYQWFKTGFKKIEESGKYEGTKTRQLTIHNVKKEDEYTFYVLVTLKEYGVSERSERFDLTPKYKPIIWIQPEDFIFKNRDNQYQNFIDLLVTVSNMEFCLFEWYRNDTLVRHNSVLYSSEYWLCKQAAKMDVGVYHCKITNECGSTISDNVHVTWGIDDSQACIGKPVSIIADNLNNINDSSYYYIWKKQGKLINDNYKFSGSKTYILSISELSTLDSGFYDVWAKNFKTNEEIYIGKSYLTVAVPPYIVKNLPDTLRYENAKSLPKKYLTVFSYGPELFYQLFKDGKPYESESSIKIYNIYEQYHPFLFGGYVNIPQGKYYYHFRNSCGEVNSKEFVIINDFKTGEVKPDTNSIIKPGESYSQNLNDEFSTSVLDENIEIDQLLVYPNPANEYVQIKFNSINDEYTEVELFDNFGKLIHKETRTLIKGINKFMINCSDLDLSNGVYFIRLKSESKMICSSVVIIK